MDLLREAYGGDSPGEDSQIENEVRGQGQLEEPPENQLESTTDVKKTKKQHMEQQKAKRKATRSKIRHQCKCSLNCRVKISSDQRQIFNELYWKSGYIEQKALIREFVRRAPIKRRRSKTNLEYSRTYTHTYFLKDEAGIDQQVCSTFFLNTIGFDKSSNYTILRCFRDIDEPLMSDGRGKKTGTGLMRSEMKEDIFSYNPTISHYRREHSPRILYLPSDLTLRAMYGEWKLRRQASSQKVGSYSLYCDVAKKNHIRFSKLGHEECEVCLEFLQHEDQTQHSRHNLNADEGISCHNCKYWYEHIQKAGQARREYLQDKDEISNDYLVVSADLQKVCYFT